MKKLLCLIFILAILSTAVIGAMRVSYTPARMTLRADVYSLYGQVLEKTFIVSNPNNFTVNISTRVTDEAMMILKEEDKDFQLEPNETREIDFKLHLTQVGNYSQNIFAGYKADNEPGMPASSEVRIIATFKELPQDIAPKGNLFFNVSQGKKASETLEVMNPYDFPAKLSLEVDEEFQDIISAEFKDSELEPNESTSYDIIINTKKPFSGEAKIYTVLGVDNVKVKIPSNVELHINELKMNPLVGIGIILFIIIIGALIFWLFMQTPAKKQAPTKKRRPKKRTPKKKPKRKRK